MKTKDNARRLARMQFSTGVALSKWVITELFKQLPDDAALVGVYENTETMTSGLVFFSEKFADVPEGNSVPVLGIQIDGVNKKVDVVMPENPEGFLEGLGDL